MNVDKRAQDEQRGEHVTVYCSPACPNARLRRGTTDETIDVDELFAKPEPKRNRPLPLTSLFQCPQLTW